MCDESHEQGALAGIELGHTGVQAENSESRLPSAAPSQLASDFATGVVPKAMTRRDIRRLVDDWAVAARRSREAGFDIVYVYGGHTYLMGQFLSPHYNRRTDEYGGSLANRARAWLETLEAVREAVGDDCAIACRVAVDRLDALGVDLDEGPRVRDAGRSPGRPVGRQRRLDLGVAQGLRAIALLRGGLAAGEHRPRAGGDWRSRSSVWAG